MCPESFRWIGPFCVLTGIGSRIENSEDQGGSMITFAMGVGITVLVLAGFGFVSTASNGWFFKSRRPHDNLASSDKNN